MLVSFVVAVGPKREIGLNNKLLWHIPEELKNFKKITTGKTIVMGRKTFESIGKPLPNRRNIVLTRDESLTIPGVDVISDPLMAFELALDYNDSDESELCVIGGAEIFNLYYPFVQKIYLSEVDYHGPADAFFLELNPLEWKEVDVQKLDKYTTKVLEKMSLS